MIEIWEEFDKFNATSQRPADQVRMILKKCQFYDLNILEIFNR